MVVGKHMKRIKAYKGNSFSFYQSICSRVKSGRTLLLNLEARVRDSYKEYDKSFLSNTLSSLTPLSTLTLKESKRLEGLYDYNKPELNALMGDLTTNEWGQADKKCPYCRFDFTSTFDHFLPKSKFKEFAVHPKNLIPSCHRCNQYKQDKFKDLLNLYLDDIPQNKQFLFVRFSIDGENLIVDYFVDNKVGLPAELFKKIQENFETLKLNQRYKDASKDTFDEVKQQVRILKNFPKLKADIGVIRKQLLSSYKESSINAINLWSNVFKVSSVQNEEVFKYIFDHSS